MLDWRKVVEDLTVFEKKLIERGTREEVAQEICSSLGKEAQKRSALLGELNELQSQRNLISKSVGELMKSGQKDEAMQAKEKSKAIGEKLSILEKNLEEVEKVFQSSLAQCPNLAHESVPVGKGEDENVEIKQWGEIPNFQFEPLSHEELAVGGKNAFDFERAAKISGARFVFLKGALAQLERALINFMMDEQRQRGYAELIPPYIVNGATMYGMGQLPKFKEDLFKVEGREQYLIPTSEVPGTSLYSNEILQEENLPQNFVCFSPCFRSEAGSYGKDTKGYVRQHQFHKVELIKFCEPEKSFEELESMLSDAENILQKLKIPYRVLLLCTGDMGNNAQKTYDLELWLPGAQIDGNKRGAFREVSSVSNCTDYQARRSSIRYKSKNFKGTRFLHTLNGSGLAVGRCLIGVLENYQQEDGSVFVPEVLKPYMGGLEKIDLKKQ